MGTGLGIFNGRKDYVYVKTCMSVVPPYCGVTGREKKL